MADAYDFSALFRQPDAQAALIAALRRQRSGGNAAQLTGDATLVPYGRSQVQQADAGEGGMLRNALMQQQQGLNAARTNVYAQSVEQANERARAKAEADAANAPAAAEAARLKLEAQGLNNQKLKRALAAQPKTGPTKEDAKRAAADSLIAIPGYTHDATYGLKPEVADKLREAVADTVTLEDNVRTLAALVRKHGISGFPGNVREQMRGLLTDIQLGLKGPAQYQLGVLAGPDMELLTAVTGDPTKLDAFVKGGVETAASKLEGVASRARARAENKLSMRGYHPEGAKRGAAKGAAGPALMRLPDGSEVEVED